MLLLVLGYLPHAINACTNSTTHAWINCTVTLNQSSPITGVFQADKVNGSWFFTFMWFTILVSVSFVFLLFNPNKIIALSYSAVFSVILTIVFRSYQLVPPSLVDVSLSYLGLVVIVMWLTK